MSDALPRYAYLGPAGTFTEAALRQVAAVGDASTCPWPTWRRRSRPSARATPTSPSWRSRARSRVGSPRRSTASPGGDPLVILREMLVPVQFTLAAAPGVALADVRGSPRTRTRGSSAGAGSRAHLPCVVHVPATSNTAPAALIAAGETTLGFDAALVPPAAVDSYGLVPLAEDIADNPSAQTRFVVVGHPGAVPPPTGADKTTLVVHLPDNEAGALLAMLEQFAVRGVNLSRIESRPIGDALGRYSFSIDAEGHITDERVGEAVMGLHRRCPYVLFLGSYPRADAVEPTVHVGTADNDFVRARTWLQGAARGHDDLTDPDLVRSPRPARRGAAWSTRADSSVTRPTMSPSTWTCSPPCTTTPDLLRPGVVDAADLGGQVVAHARRPAASPRRTAGPSRRCRRACRSRRCPATPSSRSASGRSVMPPGSLPQLPIEQAAQPGRRHRLVVEPDVHAGAPAVQVPHAGDEVRDPADAGLELLVGVGHHRGVEPEARDDEEDVVALGLGLVRASAASVTGSSTSDCHAVHPQPAHVDRPVPAARARCAGRPSGRSAAGRGCGPAGSPCPAG